MCRDPRYDYDPRDPRGDPRGMHHGDPRAFPPPAGRTMDYGGRPPVDPRAGGYDPRGDPRYQDSRYRR